jgi:hypothetical protein
MQCIFLRIHMFGFDVILNIETRMTQFCSSQGQFTHLLGCLNSDIVVHMDTEWQTLTRKAM